MKRKKLSPEEKQKLVTQIQDLIASGMKATQATSQMKVKNFQYYMWANQLKKSSPKVITYSGKTEKKAKRAPQQQLALIMGTPEQIKEFLGAR